VAEQAAGAALVAAVTQEVPAVAPVAAVTLEAAEVPAGAQVLPVASLVAQAPAVDPAQEVRPAAVATNRRAPLNRTRRACLPIERGLR